MQNITNGDYLLNHQYQDATNLNVRIALHARFGVNPYGWNRWLFDQWQLPDACRVLEIGCGTGRLWLENQDRLPAGWEILLSDFSPGMLETARQNLAGVAHAFTFEIMDIQAIPLPDASFDAVIANHMLYHVPDLDKALSEIRRVLKPGGRFFAATNGRANMKELAALMHWLEADTEEAFDRNGPYSPAAHENFSLESGAALLSPWFATVTMRPYENELRVTEADPIVAYLRSRPVPPDLTNDQVAKMRQAIEQEIAARGAFHITTDFGLFIATRD